jgi:hypothetical protein
MSGISNSQTLTILIERQPDGKWVMSWLPIIPVIIHCETTRDRRRSVVGPARNQTVMRNRLLRQLRLPG